MAERIAPVIRDAAERLLVDLVADPRFAEHVAKAEIDRLVAAGALVPISYLQMPGGLELTPNGRLAAVEGALRAILALLDADVPDRIDAVRTVISRTLANPTPAIGEKARPAAEPGPPAGTPEPATEPAPVVADDGRPPGMLKPGEEGACDRCGEVIDADQANLSFTRFRTPLCKKHYHEYGPVDGRGRHARPA